MSTDQSNLNALPDPAVFAAERLRTVLENNRPQLLSNSFMAQSAAQLCGTLASALSGPQRDMVETLVRPFTQPELSDDLVRDMLYLHAGLLIRRQLEQAVPLLDRLRTSYRPGRGWDGLSVQQVLYMLWQVKLSQKRGLLTGTAPVEFDRLLRQVYRQVLEVYRAKLDPELAPVPWMDRNRGLCIIIASDLQLGDDAATRDVFECCRILAEEMHAAPLLVSASDLPSEPMFPLTRSQLGINVSELESVGSLKVGETVVAFVHLPAGITPDDQLYAAVRQIVSAKPLFVLAFGELSPTADLCRGFVDVIAMPFGRDVPVAEPTMFGLLRSPSIEDLAALHELGYGASDIVSLDESERLTRSEALSTVVEVLVRRRDKALS